MASTSKTSILMFLNVSWYNPTDTANVIKEQRDEIDQLKARLEKLETMVNAPQSR